MKRFAIWIAILILVSMVADDCGTQTHAAEAGRTAGSVEANKSSSRIVGKRGATQNSRSFRFNYRFTLSKLEAGQPVRVWLPVPQSSHVQQVDALEHSLPAEPSFHVEPKYRNRILYCEFDAPADGEATFDVPYRIVRRELIGIKPDGSETLLPDLGVEERRLFLQPNVNVPLEGKPLTLLRNWQLEGNALGRARQLYDLVDNHVTYKKVGTGWGRGDVLWVCDSRYGNCTDFHSLFISLSRSQGIPARFEIGFPIPTSARRGKIGGYHCWAFFFIEKQGWIPVDISEADKRPSLKDYYFGNLSTDRVTFSVGRDIDLVPQQRGRPLNYFVYPYVEVSGKELQREQMTLQFSYADL